MSMNASIMAYLHTSILIAVTVLIGVGAIFFVFGKFRHDDERSDLSEIDALEGVAHKVASPPCWV